MPTGSTPPVPALARGQARGTNEYPDDPLFLSTFGHVLRGVKRSFAIANPAAGADFTMTVPGGRQWRILSINATYASSAAVATRQNGYALNVNGVQVTKFVGGHGQTASNTFQWSWVAFAGAMEVGAAGPGGFIPLPSIWLPAASTFTSFTFAKDAADQWSNIGVLVEELLFDDTTLTDWVMSELQEAN